MPWQEFVDCRLLPYGRSGLKCCEQPELLRIVKSPPVREEWIEIAQGAVRMKLPIVSSRTGGVD